MCTLSPKVDGTETCLQGLHFGVCYSAYGRVCKKQYFVENIKRITSIFLIPLPFKLFIPNHQQWFEAV